MLFRATKDTHEREEDEAERLVRPAPKVKPPRKDRRREVTHADRDPDVSGDPDTKSDKDLSLNYKTIGGSMVERVTDRFLVEAASRLRTRGPKPAKPPMGPKKYVTVLDREKNETVTILEDRAKNNPARYQILKPGEKDEEQAPPKTPEPSEPGAPSPGKPKTPLRPQQPPKQPTGQPTGEPPKGPPGAPAPKAVPGDQGQVQQRLKDLESKGLKDALMEHVTNLPSSEKTEDGRVLVFDPQSKQSVPIDQLSPKGWGQILDKFEKKRRDEATQKVLDEAAADPKLKDVLQDLAFLGGATKNKGEEEGPLAKRIRELQKEGYPLDSLPIGKNIPELKGVALPEGVRTLADLIPAAAAKRKRDSGKGESAEPDEKEAAKRVVERFLSERLNTPEFRDYAKGLGTTDEGEDGTPLFLDKTKKKMVPFQSLPTDAQKSVVDKYEAQRAERARTEAIAGLAKNPEHLSALTQVADLKGEPSDSDGPITKRIRALQAQGLDLAEIPIGKHLPELKGVTLPEGVVSVADLVDAAQAIQQPKVKRPKVTPEQAKEIERDVYSVFGQANAADVLKLHPADQKAMVEQATAYMMDLRNEKRRQMKGPDGEPLYPDLPESTLGDLKDVYQLDPDKIQPPTSVETKDGKTVPFDSLPLDKQMEEWQKHKNKVLGISYAKKNLAKAKLEYQGVPSSLALALSDLRSRPSPKAVFYSALTDGASEKALPKEKLSRILKSVPDDQRAQVSAYFQARDYQGVKDRYLDYGDDIALNPGKYPDAIHEHLPTNTVLRRMSKAMQELKDRERLYPEDSRLNLSKQFRDRTLQLFESLHKQGRVPEDKFKAIRKLVDEQEADEYDDAMKEWEKLNKARSRSSGSPYRDNLPPEPTKPEGYDEVRGGRKSKSKLERLLSTLTRTASDSTCNEDKVMAKTLHNRSAVYWGVAPYPKGHEGFAPYNQWEQAHARDLGPADHVLLLKAAKDWLRQPILDVATMDSQVPDTRFRAALDFAIQTTAGGKYAAVLHPATYNMLLARLMGQPEGETLLTLRKEAGESLYGSSSEEVPMSAATRIRYQAGKIATNSPDVALEMMALADKVAQFEQEYVFPARSKQAQASQDQAAQDSGDAQSSQESEEQAQEKLAQRKQASRELQREALRVADLDLEARLVILPILPTLKRLG